MGLVLQSMGSWLPQRFITVMCAVSASLQFAQVGLDAPSLPPACPRPPRLATHSRTALLQLLYLTLSPEAYMRHRHWINLAQRARVLFVLTVVTATSTTTALYRFHRAAQFPGSLRALVHVVVFPSLVPLAPLMNHGLPFKSELLLAPLRLLIALQGVPHQALAIELLQLGEWVQPACNALRGAILAPALLQSEEAGNFCTELGPPFLLALVHVLLGAVLPLQVGRAWG